MSMSSTAKKQKYEVPDELYYLDDNFQVRSLRKTQIQQILKNHDIPYLQNIPRSDLVNLFRKNIESKRDDILKAHYDKKEAEEKKEEEAKEGEEFGRPRRTLHKPVKLEDELFEEMNRRMTKKNNGESSSSISHKKDADGFAIPSLPTSRDTRKHSVEFNAEDSFASDDNDEYQAKPRPHKTKTVLKEKSVKKPTTTNNNTPIKIKKSSAPVIPLKSSKKSSSSTVTPSKLIKKKFTPPSFNAEDSFAESEDDEALKPIRGITNTSMFEKKPNDEALNEKRSKLVRQHAHFVLDEGEPNDLAINNEEEEEEEEDDTDYLADGDASDDEDEEEDTGEVDKEELVLLYKDQAVPPEVFVSSEYRGVTTRAQKLAAAAARFNAWKIRLYQLFGLMCALYMIIAFTGLAIAGYGRQKNGYCQNFPKNINHTGIANSETFLSKMLPLSCIPCPDHGTCTQGELVCDTLYERKTPFYNVGHMFPIGDDCVHNSVLGKYVSKVERKIKNQLAIRQGEAACEYLLSHPTVEEEEATQVEPPVARVLVSDILADLKSDIEANLPADKIDEILVIALSSILEDSHIQYWETDDQRYLGTNQAQYPLTCQLRLLYKYIPYQIKQYIFLFVVMATVVYGAAKDHRKNLEYKEKINGLVMSTTNQLKQQYENHDKDPIKYNTPALSVSQLRSFIVDVNDHRTIHDWQRVVEKIEAHPHIRKSFKEVRGDPVEYWELTA